MWKCGCAMRLMDQYSGSGDCWLRRNGACVRALWNGGGKDSADASEHLSIYFATIAYTKMSQGAWLFKDWTSLTGSKSTDASDPSGEDVNGIAFDFQGSRPLGSSTLLRTLVLIPSRFPVA
ncbi:hypothetical protein BDW69DRAFT_171963 [Aspergillus filifer]